MGKNLNNSELVMRTGKLAFYKVPGDTAYTRMEGFTDLSTNKNAKEYSRQYVDEDTERTDITGYATSTAYALDRYDGNKVSDDIVKIHEDELVGSDAVRSIAQVDMTTVEHISGTAWKAKAKLRDYSVISDSDGDTTDCMTYSGNFKARGEVEEVIVTTSDNFQTILVIGSTQAPLLQSLSILSSGGSALTISPAFSSSVTEYTVNASGDIYVMAKAESESCNVNVLYNGKTTRANGKSVTCNNVASGDKIYVIVDNGGMEADSTNTYTITVS